MFDYKMPPAVSSFYFRHITAIDRFKNEGLFTQPTRVVSDVVGAQGMGAGGSLVSRDTAPLVFLLMQGPMEVAC